MPMIVNEKQRIFFTIEGERGPYLLLHHGLLGSHRDWYDLGYINALSENFRLIVVDARGHGRSEKSLEPQHYDLGAMASDAWAVINSLDVRNVSVIGFSLGALVGFEMAIKNPNRVNSLILGGEGVWVDENWNKKLSGLADQVEKGAMEDVIGHQLAEHGLIRTTALPQADDEEAESMAVMLKALANWPQHRKEEGYPSPSTLLFQGEADFFLDQMKQVERGWSRAKRHAIPGVTTSGALEEREGLVKIILETLGTTGRQVSSPREGKSGSQSGEKEAEGSSGEGQRGKKTEGEKQKRDSSRRGSGRRGGRGKQKEMKKTTPQKQASSEKQENSENSE